MAKAKEKAPEFEDGINFADGDSVQVDLSSVEAGGEIEAMPRGKYAVIVDEVEYTESKNGNPMWSMKLKVTEGEFENRVLYTHAVFTAKALFRVKQILQALGCTELLEGPFDPQEVADEGRLIGLVAEAQVTQEKYEGKTRNSVKRLTPRAEGSGFLDS